jgi:Type I phosphodiesterase / nucleotide pyrophosphatase
MVTPNAQSAKDSSRPGLLIVQIDGLSRPLLEELIATGRMPVFDGLLRGGTLTLDSWVPLLPPCTPASQAGILHGRNDGIPGFRWYEKASGRLLVANRPRDAAEIAARVSDGRGLLADDGASVGNLLTGDAPSSHLTLATIEGDPSGRDRSTRWGGYPLNPLVYAQMAGLMLWNLGREGAGLQDDDDGSGGRRVAQGWVPAFQRVLSTVPLRILSTAIVIREMRRGRNVVYVDFTGHDEMAHGRGPRSREARRAAAWIDRSIGIILRETRKARRSYRLVILSDHGQSWGASFSERYGVPLEQYIASLMGQGCTYHGATLPTEYRDSPVRLAGHLAAPIRLGRRLVRALEGRRQYPSRSGVGGVEQHATGDPDGSRSGDPKDPAQADVVVAASGNLALISFARVPGRLTREMIDWQYPDLIDTLAHHVGIGLVLVQSADGPTAIGSAGTNRLERGYVEGDDPVAPYGPHAAESLRRLAGFHNAGDLIALGRVDAGTGSVVSFEELVGSHGGLGGWQAEPFIAHPPEWTMDADPPIGAAALYQQLLVWMTALGIRPGAG